MLLPSSVISAGIIIARHLCPEAAGVFYGMYVCMYV